VREESEKSWREDAKDDSAVGLAAEVRRARGLLESDRSRALGDSQEFW